MSSSALLAPLQPPPKENTAQSTSKGRAGREWPQSHRLHPISSANSTHTTLSLPKHPQSSVPTVRQRHTHPEFPSHLPEKCKEVFQSTEHDPEAQNYDKRSPRVKAGLYFSAGIPSKRVPPPAFQITTDKTATKMQNWFRKYLIISF